MANVWSGATIDCLDPERVARFWSGLLGREPGPSQDRLRREVTELRRYAWVKQVEQPCDRDVVGLGLLSNIQEIWETSASIPVPAAAHVARQHGWPSAVRRRSVMPAGGGCSHGPSLISPAS